MLKILGGVVSVMLAQQLSQAKLVYLYDKVAVARKYGVDIEGKLDDKDVYIVDVDPPVHPFSISFPDDSVLTINLGHIITMTALTNQGINIAVGKKVRFSFRGSVLNSYEWNLEDETLWNGAFQVEKNFFLDSTTSAITREKAKDRDVYVSSEST